MNRYALVFWIGVNLIASSLLVFAEGENVAVWERTYQETRNEEQRMATLLKIREFRDPSFIPMLGRALSDVYARKIESGTLNEQFARIGVARLLVQELGNLKATDTAEIIFNVYREVRDPDLRADASIALGRMRAVRYAEQLSRDLADINLRPDPKAPREQETRAAGLVECLNLMHLPIGYEPVFLASVGWYSPVSKVRENAKAVLDGMVDDPSDALNKIIAENPSFEVRIQALAAAETSKAPAAKKAAVARTALRVGIDATATDKLQQLAIANVRRKAVKILVDIKDKDALSAALIREVVLLDKGGDDTFDETLAAYTALGANGGDTAANFLVSQLESYNERQKSMVNTARDKQLIREIIAAMKRSKNPQVKPVLTRTQFIGEYDAAIRRDVQDALKDL